jgi:hypothetical protein
MSISINVHSIRRGLRSCVKGFREGAQRVRLVLRTLHHIVVTARAWCRREVRFLREELIAEGLP